VNEGWNFEHNTRQQVSYASLIEDGALVVELYADGEHHMRRISDVVADWEIERDDQQAARETLSRKVRAA
jgi:hypothetical protein